MNPPPGPAPLSKPAPGRQVLLAGAELAPGQARRAGEVPRARLQGPGVLSPMETAGPHPNRSLSAQELTGLLSRVNSSQLFGESPRERSQSQAWPPAASLFHRNRHHSDSPSRGAQGAQSVCVRVHVSVQVSVRVCRGGGSERAVGAEWDPVCPKLARTRQVCTGIQVPGHSPMNAVPPFTRFSYNIHSSLYKGNQ